MTNTSSDKLLILSAGHLGDDFAADVKRGLSLTPKRIPSKYFYDEKGSKLFEEIMKLPEYYPTRCEAEILTDRKDELLKLLWDENFRLVDLGAGDAKKTKILLHHFLQHEAKFTYYPIDISQDALEDLLKKLAIEMPHMKVQAIMAEYFDALSWLGKTDSTPKIVLFLGGNIGNFSKHDAAGFLKKMRNVLEEGDMLLLGVDLKKDPRVIRNAYDDAQGITADFNFNLLARINRELAGNFDLNEWGHYAGYDPITGAVLSYLISQKEQEVRVGAETFSFDAYEAIHTEYSIKYSLREIENMLTLCGFSVVRPFLSKNGYFTDLLCRVD